MYKRYVDSYYRFIFVGRYDGLPRYYAQVRALIAEYEMLPDRFWFTGPVPDEDLAAFYRWADAYVSLSEHEGFCVPLVEAMAADVPIVAYAAGAVPETLGGAGLLFAPKDLEVAAELLGSVVYDREVRARRPRGPAPPPAGLRARAHRAADSVNMLEPFIDENRLHRPTLRNRDPRRVRVPLPPDRRAPRAAAPGRSPDDLRAGLHHLEERVSRGDGPDPRRDGPPLRQRAHARPRSLQPLLGVDLQLRAHARRRDGVAAAAGAVVPGAARVPRAQPAAVRRPDLLHLPVRADGAGRAGRAAQVASWSRPRTTSRRFISRSTRRCSARRPGSPTTPTSSGAS